MRTSHALPVGVVVAGLCTLFVPLAKAQEKATIQPKMDLTKLTLEKRNVLTNRLVDERYRLIGKLINQLDRLQKEGGEGKEHIIYLLGMYRVADAVELLADMIDFKATIVDLKCREGRWGLYPAQEALVKIGKPAANEVLGRIASEAGPGRRELMCMVIRAVDGKKIGRLRITWLLEKEKNSTRRANLQAALDHSVFKEEKPAAKK